jgi:hypothetical protein
MSVSLAQRLSSLKLIWFSSGKFLIWKRDIFCKVKENKGLSGGEHSFAAHISLQIDAEIVKNSRFRTETISGQH